MATNKDNLIFEKTSFLHGVNSPFIKELYLKYLNNPKSIPQSWIEFFDGLNDDQEIIKKEILGPSWAPRKKSNLETNYNQKNLSNNSPATVIDITNEKEKEESVKAIALIRAYRIRGHLIANLDPLGMMQRKYLEDLHPTDHGFKKEDYNKKIYIGSYMDKGGYATINEILSFFRKTYCSTIGVEYMHISDPVEKIWFRERMEKKENQLQFTSNGKKLF